MGRKTSHISALVAREANQDIARVPKARRLVKITLTAWFAVLGLGVVILMTDIWISAQSWRFVSEEGYLFDDQ